MKNKIIILLAFITGFSGQINAQKTVGFTIKCKMQNLPNQIRVYLINDGSDTVGRTISNGDNFIFKGKLPLDGRFHYIAIDTLLSKIPTNAFFLMNRSMTLAGVVGERDIVMTGSPGQHEYTDILKLTMPFRENVAEILKSIEQLDRENSNGVIDSMTRTVYQKKREDLIQKMKVVDGERIQAGKKWIANNTSSLYSPFVINKYASAYGQEGLQNTYNQLTPEVKASHYGIELKNEIESIKLAEFVKPGKLLPNFKLSSTDGRSFSVLEYAKKGKITLIDFWASWCSPCRAETPNLKKVYEAFHDKGFNIIGVSSDKNEGDWKKALAEDNTKWFHGRDNLHKAWKNIFSIGAIPAYALVDGDGKLIAFSCSVSNVKSFGPPIRGGELYKTIETLLNDKSK